MVFIILNISIGQCFFVYLEANVIEFSVGKTKTQERLCKTKTEDQDTCYECT